MAIIHYVEENPARTENVKMAWKNRKINFVRLYN